MLRAVAILVGAVLWLTGLALIAGDSRIAGSLMILAGVLVVVLSRVSDRAEGAWETVLTWISQLLP